MNNPHQNARTTFYSRALIVQRVLKKGNSVREVADALGVSRRTIYKWLVRSKRGRGAGWEYPHVCVDEHSRLAYTKLPPDEKANTATCFLLRAASGDPAFRILKLGPDGRAGCSTILAAGYRGTHDKFLFIIDK